MLRKVRLLFLIFFEAARITVELTWDTEKVSYTSCPGKSQLLMWSFTDETNDRIMEFQWFFNETTLICLESKIIGFHVESFYSERVERNGTAGILLKNITFSDSGQYSLYVKLAEESRRHIQHIFLTVDEGIPYQCKPMIEIHNQNVLYCSTSCIKRSQVSAQWIKNGTNEQVGIGTYLRINEGINEHALCCLSGLKCHDEEYMSCMPNPFPSKAIIEYAHTGGQIGTNSIKATNYHTINVQILILIVSAIFLFLVVFIIVALFLWRKQMSADRKPTNSYVAKECADASTEVRPSNGTEALVNHTDTHTEAEYKKFLGEVNISTASTDQLPNRSNSIGNIQIVNNIRVDGDFMRLLTTESSREENSKLKFHVPSYKHDGKWNRSQIDKSVEMTAFLQHHSDSDTMSTSSEYEDAVSEPQVSLDWPDSVHFANEKASTVGT